MKTIIVSLGLCLVLSSCQQTKENTDTQQVAAVELSTAEKIAMAHGYDNWDSVEKLAFTFNVDRGENHFDRSWIWEPKSGMVTMMSAQDTISYNHKQVDSTTAQVDAGFINDKYWLLAPFQLLWDADYSELSEQTAQVAPISGDTLDVITITYKNEGGYTPGDAYDLYYGKDFTIKEWVFRKSNTEQASMKTTWEDYAKYGPLNLAKTHKDSLGTVNIHFTGIKVN